MSKILFIEGNIGAGKSTLIKGVSDRFENTVVVPEPLDIWNSITDERGRSSLELFYSDNKGYGFPFQVMALVSRAALLVKVIRENPGKTIIAERSPYVDKHVFSKLMNAANNISFYENCVYELLYTTLMDISIIGQVPKKYIYLRSTPSVAQARMRARDREAERNVDIGYLEKCHDMHEIAMGSMPCDMKVIIDADRPRFSEADFSEMYSRVGSLI